MLFVVMYNMPTLNKIYLLTYLLMHPLNNRTTLQLQQKWNVGPVKPVNHTSWVAVVTPTERPKSVRNRCVIELFCGIVCVVTLPF